MQDKLEERVSRALASTIRITEKIGEGGMGVVYKGHHLQLDVDVAVKVLRPETQEAESIERFRREAQLMARFKHPNIIQILDLPSPDQVDRLHLFVMQYIEGTSLAERLSRERLSPDEAVELGLQLLDALGEVHRRRVVHRDVKPSNVVFDKIRGAWVLVDFGIAKLLDTPTLSPPGVGHGTREYLPPDEAEWRDVTPQIDLYAAAATIYEAFTAEPWNSNTSPTSTEWRRIRRRQVKALRKGIAPIKDRWKSAEEFRRAFEPTFPWWLIVVGTTVAVALAPWVVHEITCLLHPEQCTPPVEFAFPGFTATNIVLQAKAGDLTTAVLSGLNATLETDPVVKPCSQKTHHCVSGELSSIAPDSLIVIIEIANDGVVQRVTLPPSSSVTTLAAEAVIAALSRTDHAQVIEDCRLPAVPTTSQFRACDEYERGVKLFQQDKWQEARDHFRQAIDLNPQLVDAVWRLYTTDVWRREDPDSTIIKVIVEHRQDLPEMDRMLFEAQRTPEGATRIARFERVVRGHPRDAFPQLLYGSELFHRGALSCIPLDSSAAVLRAAVAADTNLIEAYDQLLWVLIRIGNKTEADSIFAAYPKAHQGALYQALKIAAAVRWGGGMPPGSITDTALLRTLRQTFRWGLSLSIPVAESTLGAKFSQSPEPSARSDGFEGLGIAELSMGHIEAGLSHIDSAGAGDTGTLEAAEWRVIPAALGAFKVSEQERERGRATLRSFARSTGGLAARAAWALAVDAYLAGDAKTAATWDAILASQTARDTVPRLRGLLAAVKAGASGANQEALRLSQPSLDLDEAPQIVDPFWRSVLHLLRSRWAHAVGDAKTARCELGWSNNADIQGWSRGPAQASEVDWVIGRAVHP